MPRDKCQRKIWLEKAQAETKVERKNLRHVITKHDLFCCLDHFDIAQDVQNYTEYVLMGNVRPKLKPGVVPRVFECQSWRTDTGKTREKERTASKKRTLDSIINAEEPKVESESEMPSQCSASFNTEKPSAKRTKVPVEDDMDGSDEDAGGDGPSESDGNSESDWKESDDAATELDNISCLSRDRIRFLVKKFPMKYLGISEECLLRCDAMR